MARKTQITRTIVTTTAKIIAVDTETADIKRESILLSGKHDEKSALKQAKKLLDSDTIKVVKVESIVFDSKLYAMDEETFIKNATVIGEGRK